MKVCTSCSTENDNSFKFCKSCGKELNDKTLCPCCGAEVKSSDNFCINCSRNLSQPSTFKPKSKMGNLTKVLIITASFLGVIVIASVSLLLFNNYSTKST